MNKNNHSLILLPEIIKLQKDVVALEKELGKLTLEIDEMLNAIKPNLEAKYQQLIGVKELECLENEIAARKIKRQIELVQAAINYQKKIEIGEINDKLDEEFQEWYEKVESQYKKIEDAETRIMGLMSEEDNKAFTKFYRKLVFRLHPDLHPHQPKNEVNLWYRVQLAYKGGDLEELRSISIILDSNGESKGLPSSQEYLLKRKTKLSEQIQTTINKKADLEKEFPFKIAEKLHDKKWINNKVKEIQKSNKIWQEKCKNYNELIQILLTTTESGVN